MSRPPVSHVGVIGAGTMGMGIAYVFAEAGCLVSIVEPDEVARSDPNGRLRAGAGRADRAARR